MTDTKGITLIALIITIVVLLILAGISISMITGENGVISGARTAKEKTEISELEERIDVIIIKVEGKKVNPTIEDIIEELKNNKIITKTEQVDKKTGKIDTDAGYEIYGKLDDYVGISAIDIAQEEDKNKYYGAIVKGYDCENNGAVEAWKIFYADEKNIYLIANNAVDSNNCPSSKTQSIVIEGDYKIGISEVMKDYPKGSEHITDSRIRKLNNDYFNVKGYESSYDSMKAVAYILDSTIWSIYKGDKAEYAVGGPSIEILMKSYSQKYKVDFRAEAKDRYGYNLSKDGGETWNGTQLGMLAVGDELYTPKESGKEEAYYVASSVVGMPGFIFSVWYGSETVNFIRIADGALGFRPFICLKSEIKLLANQDGTYRIK